MTARLECHLTVGHQRVAVARDVHLEVASNELLAILGPNGAGKTTLLLTLAGILPPCSGWIRVDGRDLKAGSARGMSAAGVVLVPDSRALFTQLSVRENLTVAAGRSGTTVNDILALFPGLGPRAKVAAGMLSGGEQQMLAIGRALVQDPRILLIDELSMGLAPVVIEGLLPTVRRVADELGTAVVLVEQHVDLALKIADRAIVLVHGDVALEGPAADLRADAHALEVAYLGGQRAS